MAQHCTVGTGCISIPGLHEDSFVCYEALVQPREHRMACQMVICHRLKPKVTKIAVVQFM